MSKKEKITEAIKSNQLISAGQSSRLAAMSRKVQASTKTLQQFNSDVKPDVKTALQQANKLVEQKMGFILNAYPVGKKNSFFKLKYGLSISQINEIEIKKVFTLLKLNATGQFKKIEDLDLKGNIIND